MLIDEKDDLVYYDCINKKYISHNEYMNIITNYIKYRTYKPNVLIIKNNEYHKKEIEMQNNRNAMQISIFDLEKGD